MVTHPSVERRGPSVERRWTLGARRSTLRVLPLALLFGCNVPTPTAPSATPGMVLFSVLDPTVTEQVVLLMRSRDSKADTLPRPFDANDPIVTTGETPISGATVVLYGPAGDSAVAVEDRVRRTDKLGAGVYRVWTSGPTSAAPAGAYVAVTQGNRYRLRVTSPLGTATASVRVPSSSGVLVASQRTISLTRDSVLMPSFALQGGGFVYSVRAANGTSVEGDIQYRRTVERRLMLPTPSEDWAFAFARDRLKAGTRHVLTVAVVDSNYIAYYGAQSDPFADRSGATTLRGAAGVFAAAMSVLSQPILVAQ